MEDKRTVGERGAHHLRANLRTQEIELDFSYGIGGYRYPLLKLRDVDDYIDALGELRDWLIEQAQAGGEA